MVVALGLLSRNGKVRGGDGGDETHPLPAPTITNKNIPTILPYPFPSFLQVPRPDLQSDDDGRQLVQLAKELHFHLSLPRRPQQQLVQHQHHLHFQLYLPGVIFADLLHTTSRSLRVGSADHMSLNHFLTIVDMVVRGGWDFAGELVFFPYITHIRQIFCAGKVLSGQQIPDISVALPTCDAFMMPEKSVVVGNLISSLFFTVPVLSVEGHL